jgi:hypothetical protein
MGKENHYIWTVNRYKKKILTNFKDGKDNKLIILMMKSILLITILNFKFELLNKFLSFKL